MKGSWQGLQHRLKDLEGYSYGKYKGIRGRYEFSEFELEINYVQGDPFAAPSRIQVKLTQEVARFPVEWIADYAAQVAIADYVNRQVAQVARSLAKKRGSGKSGNIEISVPSQAIVQRTAIGIDVDGIEARLTVGLPARGRRIAGNAAAALLCDDIPQLVARSLKYAALDPAALKQHVQTFQDAEALRSQLAPNGLVAFVAAGARLARRSGVDERPLIEGAEPFELPFELPIERPIENYVELDTPHSGRVSGLGIREGVTLIVGGGYHGKSTLLKAIETGIYSHVPEDGRQQVVTHAGAVKLRAEDGRSVTGVDISPVINHLPKGRRSDNFSTANASGSTSQAAGLIEAVEVGAKVVLIDEDTAATNFMIRDRQMQTLIAKEKEPITPFVDKVRQLYDDYGVSTILVMGGSGDYFAVADTVIAMEDYQPRIVTKEAKAIAHKHRRSESGQRQSEGGQTFGTITHRAVQKESLTASKGHRSIKIKARLESLTLGYESIDLRAVEQLIEVGQVRAIAQAIIYAQQYCFDGTRSLSQILDSIMHDIERGGLDALATGIDPEHPKISGDLATFRRYELAAAINRLRTLKTTKIS